MVESSENMLAINVKWGKTTFKDIQVNLNAPVLTFREQLRELSNVPHDKQKIVVKGKQIKDDMDLNNVGLKAAMTIMMMGVAEGAGLKEPEAKVEFFEDLSPEEQAKLQ